MVSSDIEEYIQLIIKNAEKEAQKILEEARREANKIVEDAKKEAMEKAEKRAREILESIRSRIMDEKLRRFRGEKAKLKKSIVDRLKEKLLSEIENRIRGRGGVDYGDMLYRFIREAALELGSDELIISANSKDLEFIKSRLNDIRRRLKEDIGIDVKITLGEKIDVIGGITVRTSTGDKAYTATLDSLVEQVISKNLTKIARHLGLITQRRFRELIHMLLSRIDRPIEIDDMYGEKISLHPCEEIHFVETENGRIDAICKSEGRITAIYATLGRATKEKIEAFLGAIESQLPNTDPQKIFIAYSGPEETVKEILKKNNIALLTRKELFQLDQRIGARIFVE